MNKKYDRTDQERDQSRRLEQGEAEKQKARQDGMKDRGQQHSSDEPRRQQDGSATNEDGRASKSGPVREGEPGERIVDEP